MSDVEKKVLQIYEGSRADEKDLFETSHVNHVAWTLVVLMAGVVVWLAIALINAENQRYALLTKQCKDPVFKGEVDQRCLMVVKARPNWWDNLWYGATHLTPEQAK